jgi:CBS domain-containing protein
MRDRDDQVVQEFMKKDNERIGPECSLEKARETMDSTGFSSLPVVADKQLVGIITKSDIRSLKVKV